MASKSRASCPEPMRIAAIDFGTGFCSLAFTLAKNGKIANIPLCSRGFGRVATAILLEMNPDESNLQVVQFGSQAQDFVSNMSNEDLEKHLYFECFKMDLFHEAEVNREMQIKSLGGKSYYLVEVIAFSLQYLKSKFVSHLKRIGSPTENFDWVITVPAIWRASGKQMMREAAYLAGLLSKTTKINSLTPVGSLIDVPEVENPHKLTLALEPECAALYCQQLANDEIAPYSITPDFLPTADSFMVCDLGAGTVDITAHIKHGDDDIEVTIPPTGNDSGGREINKQFYHLLERIVDDTDFNKFLSSGEGSEHQAAITSIVFNEFEKVKQQFGMDVSVDDPNCSPLLIVCLKEPFVRFYSKDKISKGIKDDRIIFFKSMSTLKIKHAKMRELFQPVVQKAIECIKNALSREEIKEGIKMIYLVGGFGGCQYTCSALKEAIREFPGIQVIVPEQHTLAVSRGAVLYCRNPTIIKSRRMEASYGISCNVPFKERIHDEAYAYRDPDTGEKRCKGVFSVFVRKGQKVTLNDPVVDKIIPYSQASDHAYICFHTTTDLSLVYTEDKRGKDIAQKIGSLTLPCPNPNNLEKNEREIEVIMDFSSTEIKVQARILYLPGQPPTKAAVDFL